MATIQRINPNNRNVVPGIGTENNIFVKSGDINPLIDQVNANTTAIADMSDGSYKFDHIAELTSAHGITFDNTPNIDTIAEKTSGHGVIIDGILIKDSAVDTNVAAAGVTLSGTTLAADGTDAAIPITITPKGAAGLGVNNGSAAAPSYTFSGQTDMGFYMSSGAEIGISTAGTYRGRISVNGLEMAAGHSISAADYKVYEPGTVNSGVTAVHYGDGKNFTSILTVSKVDAITVADNAALAVGYLVYTFPAGPIVVNSSYMTMAVTLAEDTTATADVGIGTTIGSGANATLGAVGAGAENILTGQTTADCNGTPTVKTVGTQLVIEAGDNHTVYFNVADTWADTAGTDLTGDIAGTITINWTKMS